MSKNTPRSKPSNVSLKISQVLTDFGRELDEDTRLMINVVCISTSFKLFVTVYPPRSLAEHTPGSGYSKREYALFEALQSFIDRKLLPLALRVSR
jgi:hypothetical protein